MPSYKLSYFNARGKAEVARYLFALAGAEFDDHRIEGDWAENWKHKMPFGAVPVLEVDGTQICQSGAIERYLAKQFGYYPADEVQAAKADSIVGCGDDLFNALMKARTGADNDEAKAAAIQKFAEEQLPTMLDNLEKMVAGKYFLGETWPDLSIAHLMSFFDVMQMKLDYSKWPKLKAIRDSVEAEPKIAEWIGKRPASTF